MQEQLLRNELNKPSLTKRYADLSAEIPNIQGVLGKIEEALRPRELDDTVQLDSSQKIVTGGLVRVCTCGSETCNIGPFHYERRN